MKKITWVTVGFLVIGFIALLASSITYVYKNNAVLTVKAEMLKPSVLTGSPKSIMEAYTDIADHTADVIRESISIEDIKDLLALAQLSKENLAQNARVTVIGDSIVLGAVDALKSTIPNSYVDAKVSRSVVEGYDIFMAMQSRGELQEYVVISLGTNGTYQYESLFTKFIDNLEPGHKLIFVTPFDGRSNENAGVLTETAIWERTLPEKYDFVTIADWNAVISTQVHLLAGDKVHMGDRESVNIYVDCVVNAIYEAALKSSKQ